MTTTTTQILNTEWDFQNGSALKDYLFPSESNNSGQIFRKLSIPNQDRHRHRYYHRSDEIDRSMVNSSQESDFYGFTPTTAISVENTNVFFEKIPENADIVDDNDDEIGTINDEHNIRYQNDDDTTETTTTTTTILEPHQLRGKLCTNNSTEYGLEQTIASEEFSDQDIRCQNEMTKNEQQLRDRIDNAAAVAECNESHLTIEPTSSDEDDNDASLYHVGSPPAAAAAAMHKDHDEKIATSSTITTTTNFHTLCTLDEDSDNAVDNAISNERCTIGGSSTPKDLSFNGQLKKMQPSTNTNVSNLEPNNNQFESSEEKDLSTTIINEKSNLELQLQLETSREHINERSPDLFSEVDDFDATVNEAMHDDDIVSAAVTDADADDDDLSVNVSGINDSADIKTDDGTFATILSDKHIEKTERALNKRIQSLLSGIIPPPSVTFVQHDITNLLSTYKKNITLMDAPLIVCNETNRTEETCDVTDKIPMMPNELENVEWPEIKRTNAYGVHHNRTKYTDNIEIMYMKLVERYVGQETASSFTFNATNNASAAAAAAAKKKPMRKLYVIKR